MSKFSLFLQSLIGILLINTALVLSPVLAQSNPNAPNSSISPSISANWAGYVSPSGDYTSISGSWVVPSVSSANSIAADATWVGIGGVNSNDLIQAGTQTIIQNGSAEYKLWYETLPDAATTIPMNVSPGDSVSVSMTETSTNNWQIVFTDNTTNQSYAQNVSYTSTHSSAEWIEEMPMDFNSGTFLPLDDFGSVSFTNAQATNNETTQSASALGAQSLTMSIRGGEILASPSTLGSDGESFTVTRSPTEVTSPSVGVRTFSVGGHWGRGSSRMRGFTISSSTSAASTSFRLQRTMIQNFLSQINSQINSMSQGPSRGNFVIIFR